MEVKPGYKQTEVGVIPDDWEAKTVAEVVDPTAPICYGVVQVGQHTDVGVPIVAIKFVKEISHAALHRTAIELEKPYFRSRLKGGDVLISIKGTIGRVGVVPNGFDGNISRELARLRVHNEVDAGYVAHQLEADSTQSRIMRSVVGTTRLEFSIATLRLFLLPIPSTKFEQRAIAEALSDVDGLLGALDRLIAKKRDLKQAAMQQLLTGQTRLPGFTGEWEVKRLGDVASLYQPITISASQFTDSGYPVYGANGVVGFYHDFNHDHWQVTVTCRGSTCGTVNRTVDRCWITGNAMVVGCEKSNNIDKVFLYYLLANQDLSACITGTGQPQIVRGPLADFMLSIPTDSHEQTAIAEVLSDMDAKLAALEQRREKTHALKQGMMQELLTGRTRLV